MYLNTATIVGNLTRDPELKKLPSGASVAYFSIATNRTYKDKDDSKQTEFHNVVAFGKTAELVVQFLTKGSQALVVGRLQTRSWEKDGVKQYRTEIVAETVQFGARKERVEPAAPVRSKEEAEAIDYPEEEINPDDIPF